MIQQPALNPQEWRLILSVLERERGELQAEVRRTREPHLRDDLAERERLLNDLLPRLRDALGEQQTPA